MRHVLITPEEIYIRAPGNKRIQRVEANVTRKNKQDYPVLVFFDNNELEWNSNQKPVCFYNRSWAKLGYNHKQQLPLVGEELPELHQYDLVPSTRHHSDAEESDAGQGKGKGVDRNDSEDDNSPSPINILIRRSQLNTLVTSCPASPLQCSFTPVNPRVFQVTLSTQAPTSPRMATTTTTQTTQQTQTSAPSTGRGTGGQTTGASGHTPAEVLNQLNIALCCAHPSGGGGGGGGGGGAGPPLGQPAPAGQGQAAVPAAADIKAMGNLPHKFTSDRTKADEFIKEVKAYFWINKDVAGFNSPIKKVAFTLTLIKGDKVAGWVRDMGIWIDRLDQVQDNFPIVWTQFLDEFEAQFQDPNKQQQGRIALKKCHMRWPDITQYIANLKKFARQAGYIQGNTETTDLFLKGLPARVLTDVLKPPMPWDIMQLNRKPLKPPKPLYSLMQLSRLKDPKLLQAAIEAEEMCLCTHRHLLEKMHCIAHSSARTTEGVAAATTKETTGVTTNDEEDSNSSSSDNTTLPMPHAG